MYKEVIIVGLSVALIFNFIMDFATLIQQLGINEGFIQLLENQNEINKVSEQIDRALLELIGVHHP